MCLYKHIHYIVTWEDLAGTSASEWLLAASAAQLAGVIDAYGVLYDPLLSERIAEADKHSNDDNTQDNTNDTHNAKTG